MKKISLIIFILIAGLMNYTYAQEQVKYAHNRLIAQFKTNNDTSMSENGFIMIKDESIVTRLLFCGDKNRKKPKGGNQSIKTIMSIAIKHC